MTEKVQDGEGTRLQRKEAKEREVNRRGVERYEKELKEVKEESKE